ncbi:MAG: hypothetical protein K0S41_2994 [Anaerocolumna sp.]|jgi:hypothetical protein|nr:hypothetical protein [Anaerocolumna sp.]
MSIVNGISNLDNTNNINNVNSTKKNATTTAGFSSFLGETKSLDDIFDRAAKKYNLPVNLLKAVGKTESDFNEKAVSRCGAQGIMQLMPKTAEYLGVTDSFDAEQNIMGGAKYLAELYDKYDGNISYTLAAYNAGPNNVKKYGGIPPFEETQNYVKKVTNYMKQDMEAGIITTTANKGINYTVPVKDTPDYKIIDKDDKEAMLAELNSLISYDDYLMFIEKFMEDDKDNESKNESNNYFASKAISYNAPVLNLLNNI